MDSITIGNILTIFGLILAATMPLVIWILKLRDRVTRLESRTEWHASVLTDFKLEFKLIGDKIDALRKDLIK